MGKRKSTPKANCVVTTLQFGGPWSGSFQEVGTKRLGKFEKGGKKGMPQTKAREYDAKHLLCKKKKEPLETRW